MTCIYYMYNYSYIYDDYSVYYLFKYTLIMNSNNYNYNNYSPIS